MSTTTTLPDGRRVNIVPDLDEVLAAAVIVVKGVEVGDGATIEPVRDALAASHRERWADRKPSEIEPLQEARRLYHAVGIQPTRHRPSSEALLRRVLQGKDLYAINNAVDACNLASLDFLLPIGLYDLARVEGDVVLRLGAPGEEYPGIRKGPVHLEGRLGLFDDQGPFGSPTSDSQRTSVTETTRDLLGVVMATASYSADELSAHGALLTAHLTRFCGGEPVSSALLHRQEVDG